MMPSARRIIQNEDGFVIGISIMLSVIILLVGVVSILTSNTEVTVARNEGQLLQEFYNAEGGAVDALAHYNTAPTLWLTDAFLLAGPTVAGNTVTSLNLGGQGVATVEARCINDTDANSDGRSDPIAGLSDAANNLPLQRHISSPPPGSGFSLKYFEVRRYGVTATSTTGNSQVQIGAWKIFNKY